MKYPPPADLVKFMAPYDPEVKDLALSVRAFVLEQMAPCYENIYDAYSAVAIGYGWSDRLKDGVFHVAIYTSHVNLGFNHGATLDDPSGILEGKGNQIRHIKIESENDLKRRELRSYLRRAIAVAKEDARKFGGALPAASKNKAQVISTVKAVYPKKRRPK